MPDETKNPEQLAEDTIRLHIATLRDYGFPAEATPDQGGYRLEICGVPIHFCTSKQAVSILTAFDRALESMTVDTLEGGCEVCGLGPSTAQCCGPTPD